MTYTVSQVDYLVYRDLPSLVSYQNALRKLMRSKKSALKFLASIPAINYGGCLLAAYAFWLNETKAGRGENLQLVQLARYSNDTHIKTNRKFLKGKSDEVVSGAHFGWTYDGGETVFDCKEAVLPLQFPNVLLIPKHKTEQFCIESLNHGVWNPEFNRKKELTNIEKFFNIDLSVIKKHSQSIFDDEDMLDDYNNAVGF